MKRLAAALTAAVTMAASAIPGNIYSGSISVFADEEKTVRINVSAEPDNLNPWLSAASDTEAIFMNVFDGLVGFDKNGNTTPALAESWDISDDGLEYTFHLRDDVTFHNGKDFTSSDVVYTYTELAGLDGSDPLSSKFSNVISVEADDDYTVTIKLAEKQAEFLQLTKTAVLPEGYDDQETAPVGTGPFKFCEYIPGQEIVLEKNDEFYDEAAMPQIDRAEIYLMSDESAVVQALQSGQLDIATMVSAENAQMLENDFTVLSSPQNMVCLWALNIDEKPFDDVRVRQALTYAVDKQMIIDGAFGGYGTALDSAFSPVMKKYYNDQLSDVYDYDIEKAKELLKEAGLEDGFELTITVPSNYQRHIDTAVVLTELLKQIGVNAKLDLVEWGTWLEDVYKNGKYQTTVVGLSGKLDPGEILYRYKSDYSKNFFHYSNEEYDKLVEAAEKETDDEKRVEMYKQCQEILTKDAASVWTCDPSLIVVCNPEVKGYTFYPVGFYDLSSLYFE